MKAMTEGVINVFRDLRRTLNEKNFKKHLVKECPRYEINKDFIEAFEEYLDFQEISKLSLSPDCIHYLIDRNEFDYNVWSTYNIATKDISILTDDKFVEDYGVNYMEILKASSNITQAIFDKYSPGLGGDVLEHLVICAISKKVNIPLQLAIDHMNDLGDTALLIPSVKEDLQSENSVFIDKFINGTGKRSIYTFLAILDTYYSPNLTPEHISNMDFEDVDFTAMGEEKSAAVIVKMQNYIGDIYEKYPLPIAEEVIKSVYYFAKSALINAGLLRNFLIECDDITEDCLMTISESFVIAGCRDDLINYAKNKNYLSLLLAIKMQ